MHRLPWNLAGMQRCFCIVVLLVALVLGAPTDNTTPTTASGAVSDGRGILYAESCQAKLFAWRNASSSYGSKYGSTSTSVFKSTMDVASYGEQSTHVTSLVTLCDGHPRVVGQTTTSGGFTTTTESAWTNSNPTYVFASYPTPKPCSIGPKDCELLYSSWTSHFSSITKNTPGHVGGLLDPPCTTSAPPSISYSTNAHGQQCDNCLVVGSSIRLLYWPVTTVLGSGDLCNKTGETVHATATGPSRTFVTGGLTITSPTVAISIAGLSRVDNCGVTVNNTIVPVLPESVTSVEGARALFTHRQFNFADLNYKCLDDPDKVFVTTGSRTDCYRQVPASVYFTGYANAAGADWYLPNAFENRTIWDNYHPQVLPPNTLTQAIRSLWGSNCNIHPDGVWDPPIALQEESSYALPQYAPAAPTQYTTVTADPAQPAEPTWPHGSSPTHAAIPTTEAGDNSFINRPTQPIAAHLPSHSHNEDSGHGTVYTTVITYTAAAAGSAHGSGPEDAGSENEVVTMTSIVSEAAYQSAGGASSAVSQPDSGSAAESNDGYNGHQGSGESASSISDGQSGSGGEHGQSASTQGSANKEGGSSSSRGNATPSKGTEHAQSDHDGNMSTSVVSASSSNRADDSTLSVVTTATPLHGADDNTTSNASAAASPTPSSDGSLTSAIGSGTGSSRGVVQASSAPSANVAISVTRTTCLRLSLLAAAIPVFL